MLDKLTNHLSALLARLHRITHPPRANEIEVHERVLVYVEAPDKIERPPQRMHGDTWLETGAVLRGPENTRPYFVDYSEHKN